MPHVFISYVRENGDVVDRLAGELQSRGEPPSINSAGVPLPS
jgi:hypothetical protein